MHSIVGWDCLLEPWSRVEGYPSDPNPNDPHSHAPHESLFNKDGRLNPSISILGKVQGFTIQQSFAKLDVNSMCGESVKNVTSHGVGKN